MFELTEEEKLQKVKNSNELFEPLWQQLVEKAGNTRCEKCKKVTVQNSECEQCNEVTMVWSSKHGIYSLPNPCCAEFKEKLKKELDLIIRNYLSEIP